MNAEADRSIRHYFVDEDGDGTLFDRKGRVIIGTEGCSRYFLLGLVDVPDPARLQQEMDDQRRSTRGTA